MGVDLNIYRRRIGLFSGRNASAKSKLKTWHSPRPPSQSDSTNLLCVILCASLIGLLLLASAIEPNPGPRELQCKKCDYKSTAISAFVRHQYLHSQDRNFKFYCPLCPQNFKALNPFKTHLNRDHPSSRKPLKVHNPDQPNFQCSVCKVCLVSSSELRLHLGSHLKGGEHVFCPFSKCKRHQKDPFLRLGTFRTHWSIYHKKQKLQMSAVDNLSGDVAHDAFVPLTNDDDVPSDSSGEGSDKEEVPLQNGSSYALRLHDFLAKFYLKLETVYHVAGTTVQNICDDLTKISEMTQQSIAVRLRSCLLDAGLDEETIKQICLSVFDADVVHKAHHKGLSDDPLVSRHMREKFYKKKYKHVPPKRIFVGYSKYGKRRYVHYVPIQETLECMLQDESVRSQIRASFKKKSRPGIYADFTDGHLFKSRFAGKKVIYLLFFQDGLELVNPLGAARVKHKAIGMYYTLGNLLSKNRSKVNTLLLAQMFFEKDLKNFKHKDIFKDVIKDMKKLETEGILFDGERIPVILTFFAGDNLGSHMIGGFQESFSVDYFCRYCEITRDTFKRNAHILPAPWRTIETYEDCAAEVRRNKCVDSVKGVKFSSLFNELKYFHVCAPALPPCLAHDFFLGIVKQDMKAFIKYFVFKAKWFTYETLNRRIATFKFKRNDARNRPPTLTESQHDIVGSAAQNWTFLRFFGLIVADLVKDKSDQVWQLYLCLKRISELVCAPVIHESQVTYLDTLIEDYLYDLARLDPKKVKINFICKHHYLRHYPALIMVYGPLCHLWTLNFEAKHSWMRQVALTSKNFIHVTQTISEKHQLFFAYQCTGELFPEDLDCSSLAPLDISKLSMPQLLAIQSSRLQTSLAFEAKAVGPPSSQYHIGQWIVIKLTDDGLHVGHIVKIIKDQFNIFHLLMDKFLATRDPDFGHYVVQGRYVSQPPAFLLPCKELENFYPLNDYILNGRSCIQLKHSIMAQEDFSCALW